MPRKKGSKNKPVEENVEPTVVIPKESKVRTPQLLRGFKDILPTDQVYWEHVRETVNELARKYGFERIDTPLLESPSLFRRSVGDVTDIVEKEMFSFTSMGGDHMSLRPEATASIVRAYLEHGM